MTANGSGPSVLITGANGFIGSRLCRYFLFKDYRVIAGVRKTSNLALIEDQPVEYRYGDITDLKSLTEMVRDVEFIVHNAGVVKVKKPEQFVEVNEEGTRNFLEAVLAENSSVKKVVYISSLAAAGPSKPGQPITEADEPHPVTVYGRSKLAGERAALSYSDSLPVVSVRPPGVYGPGDKEVLSFFQTVARGIRPMLGDTGRKLQMVHVDDLCRGVFLAATGRSVSGSAYFICEQQSYTFKELIQHIRNVCQPKVSIPLYVPSALFRAIARISETVCRLAGAAPMLTREKAAELLAWWEVDVSKARDELGFVSEIAFPEGAQQTAEWYRREGWL